jgi:alpha-L-fucosidase
MTSSLYSGLCVTSHANGTLCATVFKNVSVTVSQPPINLALSGTASASTVQTGNDATKVNDNNTATRWCASSAAVPQWCKIDLGASKSLTGTQLMWEKTLVYKYKIETSTDNAVWTLKVDKTANTVSAQTFIDNFTQTARYVRVTATAVPSGNWASLFEFRIYGN